ncbi:hypothetical protein H0H93_015514 [Arthromyces matolae]|nr:hypothetical protein H0H93_015514 [Arthromyces matolae]
MDTYFDNSDNLLNSHILSTRDNSSLYTLKTTFGLRGRKVTLLIDENPPPGRSENVAALHWREKVFEIGGVKKTVADLRRREGKFFKRTRHWRWTPERKEYELQYDEDKGWKATLNTSIQIAARLLISSRPHLFHFFKKPNPPALHLTKTALEADEVFLILVLIYEEIKRQDRTVCVRILHKEGAGNLPLY